MTALDLPDGLKKQHVIDPEICIRCNTCEATCPVGAVTHNDANYVVDPEKCNYCMDCISPCPTGSIDNWRVVRARELYSLAAQMEWTELPAQVELGEGAMAAALADASEAEIAALLADAHGGAGGRAVPPASALKPAINLFTRGKPVVATIQGNFRITDPAAESDVRHIVLSFGEVQFPVLEGQSIGIAPPVTDADGRELPIRLYSVASARDGEKRNANNVALTVKRVPGGLVSEWLCDRKVGDKIYVTGPFGATFLMPNDANANLIMICTGTGSAPFPRLHRAAAPRDGRGAGPRRPVLRRPQPRRTPVLRTAAESQRGRAREAPRFFAAAQCRQRGERVRAGSDARTSRRTRAVARLVRDAHLHLRIEGHGSRRRRGTRRDRCGARDGLVEPQARHARRRPLSRRDLLKTRNIGRGRTECVGSKVRRQSSRAAAAGSAAPSADVSLMAARASACSISMWPPPSGRSAALTAGGAEAKAYQVDITDHAAVARAVAAFESDIGPTDILVNNAGWDKFAYFLATEPELWRKILAINLEGPLNLHHAVLKGMQARRAGRVVNIASDAGRVGSSMEAVYSSAKGGIIAFTKTMAREMARAGVTLNVVCPGPTETPLLHVAHRRPAIRAPKFTKRSSARCRSAGSASPTTSRASSPSSRATKPPTSPARSSARPAA